MSLSITGKIWTGASGLATAVLITINFSPELQGYYYTFNSILALAVLAELGLGVVIINYTSHEWAKLSLQPDGIISGDGKALSRLASLSRFAAVWYLIASVVMTLFLIGVGLTFFGVSNGHPVPWKNPWIMLCLLTGLNLSLVPVWAILEGCNQVSEVYLFRLLQSLALGFSACLAIYLGAGLWAASISSAAGLLTSIFLIGRRYGGFIKTIVNAPSNGKEFNWRSEILPMQWRIAVSWFSAYLSFYLLNPILFHYQGPVAAGQAGMTLMFSTILTAIAHSWVAPNTPDFGILIAKREFVQLDESFSRLTATICRLTGGVALTIWALVFVLNQLHHPLANRLLPPALTGCFLLSYFIAAMSIPYVAYLRAHKKEPFLGFSIISGLLHLISIVLFARYYGVEGVAIGYLIITAGLFPVLWLIWQRCRNEWHTR